MIQQFTYPTEETDEVGVGTDFTRFRVTVGLEELCEPDGRVDCEVFARECFDGYSSAGGEEELPEAFDSHS